MAILGSKRPNAHLTDARILIEEQLQRVDLSDDYRVRLLEKFADLELLAKKKYYKRRARYQKKHVEKPKGKRGRPIRKYDSNGVPLYQDVPEPVQEETNLQNFLEQLGSETNQSTQSTE